MKNDFTLTVTINAKAETIYKAWLSTAGTQRHHRQSRQSGRHRGRRFHRMGWLYSGECFWSWKKIKEFYRHGAQQNSPRKRKIRSWKFYWMKSMAKQN